MYVKIIRKTGRKNRILIYLAGLKRRRKEIILGRRAGVICRGKDLKVIISLLR